jgi:hypothetical protein
VLCSPCMDDHDLVLALAMKYCNGTHQRMYSQQHAVFL